MTGPYAYAELADIPLAERVRVAWILSRDAATLEERAALLSAALWPSEPRPYPETEHGQTMLPTGGAG